MAGKLTQAQVRALKHIESVGTAEGLYADVPHQCHSMFSIRAVDRTLDSLMRRGLITDGSSAETPDIKLTPAGRDALEAHNDHR